MEQNQFKAQPGAEGDTRLGEIYAPEKSGGDNGGDAEARRGNRFTKICSMRRGDSSLQGSALAVDRL